MPRAALPKCSPREITTQGEALDAPNAAVEGSVRPSSSAEQKALFRLNWALVLLIGLFGSQVAHADFRDDYARGVRSSEISSPDWREVRARMEAAIAAQQPPFSGVVPATDKRPGGLDYLPHAYLAIAILKTSGDCDAARRAIGDPGHRQASTAAKRANASIARQAEQLVAADCGAAPPAVPRDLLERARRLLEEWRNAVSDVRESAAKVPLDARDGSDALVSNADRRIGQLADAIEKQDQAAIESALRDGATFAQDLDSELDRLEGMATALAASESRVTSEPDPKPTTEPVAHSPQPSLSAADRARIASLLRDADTQLAHLADLEGNGDLAAPDVLRLSAVGERTEKAKRDLIRVLAQESVPAAIAAESVLTDALSTMRSTMRSSESARAAQAEPPSDLIDAVRAYLADDIGKVIRDQINPLLPTRARAHMELLKSAAYFREAKLTNADSSGAERMARSWAKAAKRTDPSIAPNEAYFTKAFILLFREA